MMDHGKEIWDIAHHDIPERHEFGKAFGIPKFPTFKPGISPIPAEKIMNTVQEDQQKYLFHSIAGLFKRKTMLAFLD